MINGRYCHGDGDSGVRNHSCDEYGTVAWYRWFHGDCCGTVYHNDSTVCTASEEIFIYANGEESDREEEKEVI